MTCKHCEMRERESGNVIYVEGEQFEHPPYYAAYIGQECDYHGNTVFWLHCETRGWGEGDDVQLASIPVRHCPWCGETLRGVDL